MTLLVWHRTVSLVSRSLWVGRVALALGLAVGAWGLRPGVAAAQRTGNFCMVDNGGASCTANDVSISSFAGASYTDRCSGIGDTATAIFRVAMQSASSDKYDYAFTIDKSGSATGAYDGNNCYHDYLHDPVLALSNTATPPGPPYLNDHGGGSTNVCGDGGGNGNTWVMSTQSVTFTCADNFPVGAPDGQYDIQICSSWKVGRNDSCVDVTEALPSPGSKCNCQTFNIVGPLAVDLTNFRAEAAGGATTPTRRLAIALMLGAAVAAVGMMGSRRRRVV